MREKTASIFCVVLVFAVTGLTWGQIAGEPNSTVSVSTISADVAEPVELTRYEKEFSSAYLEPARMGEKLGVAVIFEGTDDLHYYAKPETAPAAGFELKVEAKSDYFGFGEAIFPKWDIFTDLTASKVEVYVGRFAVFVPIKAAKASKPAGDVEVTISGQACTSKICLLPFETTVKVTIDYSQADSWKQISFEAADGAGKVVKGPGYSVWFALVLALLAGLSLNIMPCVWPVLPLIVMRIVEQAKADRKRSFVMGLAFCLGILLFFACLAGANIVLQVFYGTVLQWGDQFRSPVFVGLMALLLVVLALFMFGVFTITVPSSIAGKSGSGKGYSGAVGIGFLAAILSTPCSFAILAAAFAWAQAQPLPLGTVVIMVIGVGMAVPYAILTSIPGLLNRLPKAGRWMELFKQAIGFVLLVIAVKLIAALPEVRRMGVLYFAVVLSFCVWMWAGWVTYNTKPSRKWLVRTIAVALVVTAGWALLPAPAEELIEWQKYDAAAIETAKVEGRPVLIKFTADWCWNCEVVEKVVYGRKDIARLIEEKGALAVKADTTVKDSPAALDFRSVYGELSLPVSILFLPGEKEAVRWRGKFFFAKELKKLLEKLPSK